jgi:hypothetical protein
MSYVLIPIVWTILSIGSFCAVHLQSRCPMSDCPICKTSENVKSSWTTGYQRQCSKCGVLFDEHGTEARL